MLICKHQPLYSIHDQCYIPARKYYKLNYIGYTIHNVI